MLIKSCFSTESGGKMLSHAAESNAALLLCASAQPNGCKDQAGCGEHTVQGCELRKDALLFFRKASSAPREDAK